MIAPVNPTVPPINTNQDSTTALKERTSMADKPTTSFKVKWMIVKGLLLVAVVLALPPRLGLISDATGFSLLSAFFYSTPSLLLALAAWIVLKELATSPGVMKWFVVAISLAITANVLNSLKKMPALIGLPLIGFEGAYHGLFITVIELTAYLVFFFAFAKAVLTLREMTDLAERRSAKLQEEAQLRAELQDGLISERNDAKWLAEKLGSLNEATMILSEATGVYDLCRRAVVIGRCQLGFDRLGIWLLGDKPGYLYGTYGVDENGMIRDERNSVLTYPDHMPSEVELLRSGKPLIRTALSPLRNNRGEVVGEGDHAVAALWDGDSVVGEITSDTLFSQSSFTRATLQLLGVYANVIGHLLTQKRLEESLTQARDDEERLHTLLSALHQITLELARSASVDDLCRESVQMGKLRLGFSRIEIRLGRGSSDILQGTYRSSEDGTPTDISEITWDSSSLDPVCAAAMSGEKQPISACLLENSSQTQGLIWRHAIPLVEMERSNGLLVIDHLVPDKTLSMANQEIALLFGEALAQLVSGRIQEEQRKQWTDQLAQSQRLESLGILVGGIAHDFNNILGAMIGFTEMASEETPPDSEIKEMQEQVLRAGFRAKELIRQILTFSRRTAIGSSEPILPHLIVKEALNLLRASVPSTIRIQSDIKRDCGYVLAEPTHIHQIVMNLCTNAYQAMREKGDLLEVSLYPVELSEPSPDLSLQPGKYIRFQVRDNGIGMDYETLQRANEPFFTTKPLGEGTGLGLSNVQGIASSLGGALHITSTRGEGTTVEVYLPQCTTLANEETDKIHSPSCEFTGLRVLVVDDEPAVCLVTTKQLERLGQTSRSTPSPLDALDLLKRRSGNYDLLITDLTMPDMTGLELAEAVHQILPGFPIILMSGNLDTESNINLEQAEGISEILQKPVALKDLADCLNRVFETLNKQPDEQGVLQTEPVTCHKKNDTSEYSGMR